ncbi:hypothetical protein OG705_30105 [Streptomyces sp. NBC_00838]|uniref:hypothetical protein n=1 Tax=Streptomyces sp. NBC_00838 TaxID=2903680 RepID=UPI00386AC28B|nr:hypothetical protein OG705_30105 [Streptomyces sp. NBC_00838]
MSRTTPKPGARLDINTLVEKLDEARGVLAHEADKDYYERHHEERSQLDTVFDDLIDYLRANQAPAELDPLIKSPSDPSLRPGDLIRLDGHSTVVRKIKFLEPGKHSASGLPQHLAAFEVVTSLRSEYISLVPAV